jgi:glutamine synthetase
LAPIFEETNLAVDHNCLLMDVMEKCGTSWFESIISWKPFKGVNGSGNIITGH